MKKLIKKTAESIMIKMGGYPKECVLLARAHRSYYKERGWFTSIDLKESVDANGEGIPWFCYQAIDFLQERIKPDFKVWEYGMGGSTDWWSRYAGEVKSVDHDRRWFDETRNKLSERNNIECFLCEVTDSNGLSYSRDVFDENLYDDNGYANRISSYKDYFDIVVVDGLVRQKCCKACLNSLKKDGIIIFDNSEREMYSAALDYLKKKGFRNLSFFDYGPCNLYRWKTSIYYRENNCLGI